MDTKVYRMNDYEWWASNLPVKETLAFYLKETGVTMDDTYPLEQIKECDLDKEGMYIPLEDTEKIAELEKLGLTKQIIKSGHGCGFGTVNKYDGDWYIKVPFRQALEYTGFGEHSEPVGIASTES